MTTEIRIEYDAFNFPTSYECKNRTQTTTPVTISFLYDFAFNKTVGFDLSRAYVETGLLQQLAFHYGLWDGTTCGQAHQNQNNTWFVRMSSLDIDIPNPELDSCFDLVSAENQECVSMMGYMSGRVIGPPSTLDTLELIALHLNSGAITQGSDVSVLFLGEELHNDTKTSGRDNLPPSISVPENLNVAKQQDKYSLTSVGVAILAGFVITVLAVMFVIFKRKRHAVIASDALYSLEDDAKSAHDIQLPRDFGELKEEDKAGSTLSLSNGVSDEMVGYEFSLGGRMKSELIGIHGENAITASASYQQESDSDSDSWAQTEGTLGSLELRLDPIEAEV